MTILAGDILRTSVNFTLADGTLYQNIFHHRRVGPGLVLTDAQHVAAIAAWAEAMYDELVGQATVGTLEALSSVDQVAWSGTEWAVVDNIGVFTINFVPVAGGTLALPNQVSPFVTFKTARPKSVGRKFLFPLAESSYDSGVLLAAAVTAIVAWADDAVNTVVVDAPLDYLVPGVTRVGVDDFLDFTLAIVTNLVGTQRRRRLGYGA